MNKVALRGLLSRKLRSVLTGFAVVIGVAFVVGTLVFTDTIDESFKNLFERTSQGVDVSVEGRQAVKSDFSVPPTMPADTLEKVKSVPGVAVAEGGVSSDGTLLDKQGDVIVSQGPPTLIISESTESVFQVLDYEEGSAPSSADQVALDRGTAKKFGFKVGDKAIVSGRAPAKEYTVSGIATIGGQDSLGGARMVAMTLPEAQRATGHDGYDSISISTGGEDPDTVKAAVSQELGRDFLVRTGKEAAEQQAQDLSDALGFLRIALLIFAGVALLVGGFLIFNTFTVTVAQRTKEFALLRVLGASRGQILRSVLIETFAIGLLASILGVLTGLLVAPALAALLRAGGIDLGTTGIVVAPATVIIGLAIGLVATMVSGFVPALRATRVEPVTAMRDAVTPGLKHMGTIRIVGSGLLVAAGLAVLFIGLFGGLDSNSAAASLIGLGAVLMMFAFAFLAPLLVRPLARVLGAPMARFQGLTGVLARENAIRQPQRTAVTAAALMVGLALVVLVAVFAAGLKATINGTVDDQVKAALVVQNQDGFSPIPAEVISTVQDVPGVTDVASMRFAVGQVQGDSGTTAVNGIDAETFNSVLTLNWVEGNAEHAQRPHRPAGDRRVRLGRFPRRRRRRRRHVHDARGQAGHLPGGGHVQEPGRAHGRRAPHQLGARAGLEREGHRLRDGRRRPGHERRRARGGRQHGPGRIPADRGADPRGVQGQRHRLDRRPARAGLRPVAAVRDRRPAGHREHARAVRARAHARARHAPRGRHDPSPGAPDGPCRVRDHRGHRRDPGHRARGGVRR